MAGADALVRLDAQHGVDPTGDLLGSLRETQPVVTAQRGRGNGSIDRDDPTAFAHLPTAVALAQSFQVEIYG
ncbi:MAG: hypothetical protein F4184_05420 [Gemmatimonadetes bacterium]|nr:hypothetical protein [Gemmatimonadota bacterium]